MREIPQEKINELLIEIIDQIVSLKEEALENSGLIWYGEIQKEFIDLT